MAHGPLVFEAIGRMLLPKPGSSWWWLLFRRHPSLRQIPTLLLLLAICRGGWLTVSKLKALSAHSHGSRTKKRSRAGSSLRDSRSDSADRLASLGETGMIAAFNTFYDLFKAGACCDAVLVVGGLTFKAHKCVLAAASVPLRTMLEAAGGKDGSGSSGGSGSSVIGELMTIFQWHATHMLPMLIEILVQMHCKYTAVTTCGLTVTYCHGVQ